MGAVFKVYVDAARVNAGMTQSEWADVLGVSKVTISNWESGIGSPSIEQVHMMSSLSGIPESHIFLRSKAN